MNKKKMMYGGSKKKMMMYGGKKPKMMKKGGLKMVMKDGKMVPFYAADGKGAKDLGRAEAKKGGKIPPQLKKYVMAKKKKAKKK